ncbi:OmpA family protein [Longispora sp. NPDC051575]|uniref:OmpA family protein n=1 Tax=Longispora sp. NPDC051575 TaxID=3154943 RepID=UPI003429DC38
MLGKNTFHRLLYCVIALLFGLVTMSGCTDVQADGAVTADGARASDCAKLAALPGGTGTRAALVVDNTASGTRAQLPPGFDALLADLQKGKAQLTIIAVDGRGRTPQGVVTFALNPDPTDSDLAQRQRAIAISCISTWMRGDSAQPTAPGSDIVAALNTAARHSTSEILVVSDGVSNAGAFDINTVGFDADPKEFASRIRPHLAAELTGKKITWGNFGETNASLPESARTDLKSLWTSALTWPEGGAQLNFVSEPGKAGGGKPATQPDEARLPVTASVTVGCRTRVTIPASLLFTAGSVELRTGSGKQLQDVANTLVTNPSWMAEVAGHAANYGTTEYQTRISTQRAETVASTIASFGVAQDRIRSIGHGSTQPAVPEFVNNVHDENAAAQNRRVVIEMGPKGCQA